MRLVPEEAAYLDDILAMHQEQLSDAGQCGVDDQVLSEGEQTEIAVSTFAQLSMTDEIRKKVQRECITIYVVVFGRRYRVPTASPVRALLQRVSDYAG